MAKANGPAMSQSRYIVTLSGIALFTLLGGYTTATQPEGAGWRFFSYHPFLMISAFVGMMLSGAVTKKLGGYTNTKLHAKMGMAGLIMAYGGLYVIYQNKNNMGKPHFTSNHSLAGIICLIGVTTVGMAGGIFLHPDFGIAKTNKRFRFVHFWCGRIFIMMGWCICLNGLQKLTTDVTTQAMIGVPLLLMVPFALF